MSFKLICEFGCTLVPVNRTDLLCAIRERRKPKEGFKPIDLFFIGTVLGITLFPVDDHFREVSTSPSLFPRAMEFVFRARQIGAAIELSEILDRQWGAKTTIEYPDKTSQVSGVGKWLLIEA